VTLCHFIIIILLYSISHVFYYFFRFTHFTDLLIV